MVVEWSALEYGVADLSTWLSCVGLSSTRNLRSASYYICCSHRPDYLRSRPSSYHFRCHPYNLGCYCQPAYLEHRYPHRKLDDTYGPGFDLGSGR